MKKSITHILFCTLVLIVCLLLSLLFGLVLFAYSVPVRDAFYDISLLTGDREISNDWQYDQKGWTVFIQEEAEITPLTPNGIGGFAGLRKPGQTFYYSRTLTEALESPMLRLTPANQSVAVFLDGRLLYTDCPELDNRIGRLTLPTLDQDRTRPVVLSLPLNYQGKTLTVAQSSGQGDRQDPEPVSTVWPCGVYLYSGDSYESALIAESFRTAIPASLCFGAGILLLAVFLWQFSSRKMDWGLMLLALASFLWSTRRIAMASLPYTYFHGLPVDVAYMAHRLSLTVLLLFSVSRLTGKPRLVVGALGILHGAAVLLPVNAVLSRLGLWLDAPAWIGLLGILCILACMGWERKQGNVFFRFFCPMAVAGLAAFTVGTLAVPALRQEAWQQFTIGSESYFLWRLMWLMMPAAILSAFMEWITKEITRRTEAKMLAQQYELSKSGFENLRRHHEEVMMLRHDMEKHLIFLRQSTSDQTTAAYLEELIGKQHALSPVVQSRNRTLDIILNAKLGEAAERGIAVEVTQTDAPESLPLSDTDLCALVTNLLENAIHAACETEAPFLRLDMHQKDGFFVFVCENAAAPSAPEKGAKKEAVSQHGLGLKIMEQIVSRYGSLMEVERLPGSYRVTIALLLDQSLK